MRSLWRDETGTVVVEYALLLALLVLATVAGWRAVESAVETSLNASVQSISTGQN